ncbi:putative nitrogen fixation protein NifT [Stutzerimonas kirkiae]|uniref:Putative nitrogen fixation protein NifT n=1 Tax=Stutzerimonas kirkiae TaxID=2211392 RepID=A0A4Q9RCC1_9GAMM|nr:putative nitrogen fixation protein NifT [Stutzerimonas kirkiae]TBU98819.1 putative nitrogen fixation protein NifT [Stutzerimonas kirkiae]TBV03913.1 putative nitrogen fixation protein NifT [Stutzerimonas kirkiae]TBV09674.1 putative nitrogen fixation protein NifT [Stutzerimonas kirkiae]TBV16793.1 putative nitrogen fixation protein NifT [Stutzerimonas kirkiae]
MPSVMINRNKNGQLTFYIAKKDQEEIVLSLEHDGPERWGGEVSLTDGSSYYLDPLPAPPKLPITLRARRSGE